MTLPRIGESLDKTSTLEAKARVKMRDGEHEEICSRCQTSPYPRGFIANTGNCYWCEFPR
jgi:hypothetical protein